MTHPSPYPPTRVRHDHVAAIFAWSVLGVLALIAALEVLFLHPRNPRIAGPANIGLLVLAAAALLIAVRKIRGRTRIADAFFPLVLLNPMLYTYRGQVAPTFDTTLIATGLLGLMTGVIVAMRRDSLLRYLGVAALALALIALANSFLMLLPALTAWFLYSGFTLARSATPNQRVRGMIIMGLGEILLFFFGLGCLLEKPAPAPPPSTLFSTIVGFGDFPLTVLAIVMLALGWRKGPHGTTPPHFAGMLALLLGVLTLLLNNFQSSMLPPPGSDQTVLVLCLLYIVFAIHGPRRLQWVAPPVLLVLAVLYTFFR